MKRSIVLTAVLLVLAAAILTVGNAALNRTEAQTGQNVVISRGDPSAAEGLTVGSSLTFDNNLLCQTRHDAATGRDKTDFSFHAAAVPFHYTDPIGSDYQLFFRLCDSSDGDDPICRDLAKWDSGGGITRTVRLSDYYDTYPLTLGESFMGVNELSYLYIVTGEDWVGGDKPFTPLQIPVEPEDTAEVYFYQGGSTAHSRSVSVNLYQIAHRYWTIAQECDGGVLTTVGFAPDAQPQKDWAPEGFGLWMVPATHVEKVSRAGGGYIETDIHTEEARIVYPLDIETQSVLALRRSGDGKDLLLVTAEDGKAVLRVLDGTSYQLRCTLPLGKLDTSAEQYTLTLENGEHTVTRTDYEDVAIHTEEDFTAVAVGNRLVVFTASNGSYREDFTCDMAELCVVYDEDERIRFWGDDEEASRKYDAYQNVYTPISPGYYYYVGFEQIPMVWRDHKLAIAWYAGDYSLHLHVYGADGLLYAECTESPLLRQDIDEFHSFYLPSDLPELEWAG